MRLRASDAALAVGGRLEGPDVEFSGATNDSRSLLTGQLFIPIVAERDGHDFIGAAVDAGAPIYLSARGRVDGRATCIEVADTGTALLALGRLARDRLPNRVVGVTGSVGKTTVKDLAAGALTTSFVTAASERSFNNEIGVPLTLTNAPDDVEAAVIEMGARGAWHIAALCAVARPTIGVVTVVAAAHTELFGSVEAVAQAKAELVEALPAAGTAVLNAADQRVAAMADRTSASVLTFSANSGVAADLTAARIEIDGELRPSFHLTSPWGHADVHLTVRGAHNVANALAAAGAALSAGAPLAAVVSGLATARGSPWRMDVRRSASGVVIVNDAYNANPTSVEAALRALSGLDADRRFAVLGRMAELGTCGSAEHARMGELAFDLGISVVAVDTVEYGSAWPVVRDANAALTWLRANSALEPGAAVLVKGSRVAGLEGLAAALLEA